MLMDLLGREAMLEGLRNFTARSREGPDYSFLQNQLNTLREFAPDTVAFDQFLNHGYFDVVDPDVPGLFRDAFGAAFLVA
jgi:hypothetical protein